MRFPVLLIFVLLIPAFIALGHDIYLFFSNEVSDPLMVSTRMVEEKFKFSAFGFIWTNYDPEGYRAAARGMSPESWAMVDKFLTIKAFYGGLFFAGAIIAVLALLGLMGVGPMAGEGGGGSYSSKGKNAFSAPTLKKKGGKIEYKRK